MVSSAQDEQTYFRVCSMHVLAAGQASLAEAQAPCTVIRTQAAIRQLRDMHTAMTEV